MFLKKDGLPVPVDEFAKKYDKPENKFYNWVNGKWTKPIMDKDSGKIYHVPVSAFQIVVLPDGTLKGREV